MLVAEEDAAGDTRKTVRSGNALLVPGSVTRTRMTFNCAHKKYGNERDQLRDLQCGRRPEGRWTERRLSATRPD